MVRATSAHASIGVEPQLFCKLRFDPNFVFVFIKQWKSALSTQPRPEAAGGLLEYSLAATDPKPPNCCSRNPRLTEPNILLVKWLKWTQLVVAIAATFLAALIWPGIMVVIPLAIGLIYIASAIGALRGLKFLQWSAFLVTVAVFILSSFALSANDFAIFRIDPEMGDPPMAVASATGELAQLDGIPEQAATKMRADHASAVRCQKVIAALVLLVWLGACAVVLMHLFAWKWLFLAAPDYME